MLPIIGNNIDTIAKLMALRLIGTEIIVTLHILQSEHGYLKLLKRFSGQSGYKIKKKNELFSP